MQNLIEAVMRFDETGDIDGLNHFVVSEGCSPSQVYNLLTFLLRNARFRSAFLLAMMLEKSGVRHANVALALSAGGFVFGRPDVGARGLKLLSEQADAHASVQEPFLDEFVLSETIRGLLSAVLPTRNNRLVIRVIDVLKAAVPECRAMFDWDAPVPELSLEKMRQRRPQMSLVNNPLPPIGAPRPLRRVLILANWYGGELRFVKGMHNYGWHAEVFNGIEMTDASAVDDSRTLIEVCRQKKIDILLFDVRPLWGFENNEWNRDKVGSIFGSGIKIFNEMKAQLREENPSFRILGAFLDSSDSIERTVLESETGFFDGLLSIYHNPMAPHILNNPQYGKKFLRHCLGPFNSYNYSAPERPLLPQMCLRATVGASHMMRALWLSAAAHKGIAIDQKINQYTNRSERYMRSPLEDYAAYMQDLTEATCCLSVTMSGFMQKYINWRSFEVPLSGSLLVQDFTPLMHGFFVPGEHYLEFSSITELLSITRFITERRDEAEEVRRRGYDFAHEQYNDDRLIGQIDKFLYY